MMTTAETMSNVLRRQTLELTLPGQQGAHGLQEEVRRIVYARLLPAMDELFSRLGPPNEVIELERVEIDLGDLASGALDEQLVGRAREKLEEVLSQEIAALRESPNRMRTGARILDAEQSRVELVRVFLASGEVPWWAPGGGAVDVEAVLRGLLATATAAVVELLREVAVPTVAARIVKQFAPATRRSLLAVLAPSYAPNIKRVIADWGCLLSGEQTADEAVPGASFDPLRFRPTGGLGVEQFIESAVLYLLMSRAKRDLTTEEVSRHVVARVAAETVCSEALVLDRLIDRSFRVLPTASEVRGWLEHGLAQPGGAELGRGGSTEGSGSYPRQPTPRGVASDSEHEAATTDGGPDTGPPPVEKGEIANGAHRDERDRSIPRPRAEGLDRRLLSDSRSFSSPPGLVEPAEGLASMSPQGNRAASESQRPVRWRTGESLLTTEGQYIDNAGLIVLWPFLSRFFEKAGLVEDKVFRSEAQQERGILLLQHVVTGDTRWPEPVLLLNKILCGWPHDEPVAKSIEIGGADAEEVRALLTAVIENWRALKNTSVEGLRTAFLRREGHLMSADEGWKLRVARTGYDVLLDQLPWGVGLVLLPWMKQPVFVEW